MALNLSFLNPLNWSYSRLKDGTHWYTIGNGDVNWELGDKLNCLLTNPVAFRCADIIADKLSQMKVVVDDDPEKPHPIKDLLENPNPFQSKQDFLKEYYYFKTAYGWVYQLPMKPSGFDYKIIYNLNPGKINYNNELFSTRLMGLREYDKASKEKQFKYLEQNQHAEFNINEVIAFYDIANGLSNDFLLKAPSRLNSIQKQLKNIDIVTEAKGRSMKRAGRWIVTGENTGQAIKVGLRTDEKADIETRLSTYGLAGSRNDIIATTAKDIKAHSLHVPANQLGFNESVEADAQIVREAFGVSREIYNLSTSGATYENQKEAKIGLIQDVVQVEGDDIVSSYKSFFGMEDANIKASFQHLPEMQYIENLKADKMLKISAAIRNISGTNVTEDELFQMAGIERQGNE